MPICKRSTDGIEAVDTFQMCNVIFKSLRWKKTRHELFLNTVNRKTSNISRTLVGNNIVDHSDVVGAAPTGRRCSNYIFILDLTSGFKGIRQGQPQDSARIF